MCMSSKDCDPPSLFELWRTGLGAGSWELGAGSWELGIKPPSHQGHQNKAQNLSVPWCSWSLGGELIIHPEAPRKTGLALWGSEPVVMVFESPFDTCPGFRLRR